MSPLLSARLQKILEALSDRDRQILQLIARFRLMSGSQIQTLMFESGQYRTCRRVLTRLESLDVIATLDRRIGGVRAGSVGYVYRLASNGFRILTELDQAVTFRLPRASEPSLRNVEHTLAVGDVFVALKRLHSDDYFSLRAFDSEPASWRPYVAILGGPRTLKPDAFVRAAKGEWEYMWFVEVDRSTESIATLRRKLDQYVEFWRTGQQQASEGAFPMVAWLTNTERQATRLAELIDRLPPEHRRLFRVGQTGREEVLFVAEG
jgi:hypothetical protein